MLTFTIYITVYTRIGKVPETRLQHIKITRFIGMMQKISNTLISTQVLLQLSTPYYLISVNYNNINVYLKLFVYSVFARFKILFSIFGDKFLVFCIHECRYIAKCSFTVSLDIRNPFLLISNLLMSNLTSTNHF